MGTFLGPSQDTLVLLPPQLAKVLTPGSGEREIFAAVKKEWKYLS